MTAERLQVDPAYIAHAQAALAMHYVTHAGYAAPMPDPAQLAALPPAAHTEADVDPTAAGTRHTGLDPATLAAMASAAALAQPGDAAASASHTQITPADAAAVAEPAADVAPAAL